MAQSKRTLVRIRITDARRPEKTRWQAQRPIQNAAGFRALGGFTDARARRGSWHSFRIAVAKVPAFEREIRSLVRRRRVEVQIAGAFIIVPAARRAAPKTLRMPATRQSVGRRVQLRKA